MIKNTKRVFSYIYLGYKAGMIRSRVSQCNIALLEYAYLIRTDYKIIYVKNKEFRKMIDSKKIGVLRIQIAASRQLIKIYNKLKSQGIAKLPLRSESPEDAIRHERSFIEECRGIITALKGRSFQQHNSDSVQPV